MPKFYTPSRLSENIAETPEGFLFCLGVPIARTGWQTYGRAEVPLEAGPEGTIEVYRDPKDVFRPQTIASFQGKSITIRHPEDFVGPKNWKDLTHGTVQNVRKAAKKDDDGEEVLEADLLITSEMAIQLVKNGLREVSCGYECEYEQTGEGEGRQFNIIGNHTALVDEGRAGPTYAINDHKGDTQMDEKETLIQKLKKKLGAKVVDEALKEDKKEDKAKDADSYDELKGMMDEMMSIVKGFAENMGEDEEEESKEKPAPKKKAAEQDEEEESEDEDEEEKSSIESRMKAVETALAKLLENKAGDEDEYADESEDEDEDAEESEDEEGEEGEESMTGDSAAQDLKARIEILAPGLKVAKGEDARAKALEVAYKTKDGKQVINSFTGGKKLTLDSKDKERINTLFIATSECLKASRGTGLEETKDAKRFQARDGEGSSTIMTPEKMNEINAAHYGRK